MVKQKKMQQKIAVKKRFLQGFSLIELLVVISLLGVVAMAATTLIIDTGEEKRKDATEKNWDAIRKAIVGDSTQSLNGSPYLSGYVADMGRLPNNIKELMSQNFDYDHDGDEDNVPPPSSPTPRLQLVAQPQWQAIDLNTVDGASGTGVAGNIYGGWRGPYLYTAGSQFFRSGWNSYSEVGSGAANETQYIPDAVALPASERTTNTGVIVVEDALNFGWNVSHSPTLTSSDYSCGLALCDEMKVQSLGEGNLFGDATNIADSLDYSQDFPAISSTNIVSKNDWQINYLNFDVVFNKPCPAPPAITCPTNLELRIFNFEDDGIEDGTGTPANTPQDSVEKMVVGLSVTTTAIDSMATASVSGTEFPKPIGHYVALVVCNNSTNTPPTPVYLYDGDCSNPSTRTQPYYFTVMPGTTKVTIPWNIP